MKIGIFTFHCAVNYGAVLQAYCLQETLKKMGHEVYIVDYRPKYLLDVYSVFSYNSYSFDSVFSKCKGFLRSCLVAPIRWKRNKVFSDFINSRLNLYKLDLNDESNNFDAFVFGSDQIWNPKITCGFDKVYLGDFPAAKGKKLIAYAASVGSILNLSGENVDYFLYRLKYFDKILVREKSLADYINSNTSSVAEVVLDPVLLAGKPVLKNLLPKRKKVSYRFPYLLLFQIGRSNEIAEYATQIAEEKKIELIDVVTMRESLSDRTIKQTLPVEYLLEYFENAAYIVTSSFHGTAFSIVFGKQFNTVSVDSSTDERALSLLNSLQISDRMVSIQHKYLGKEINYSFVDEIYVKMREESLSTFVRSKDRVFNQ